MKEKFISGKNIFKGKIISVNIDTVALGRNKYSTREVVKHGGAVAILPVTKDNKIILVEQFRYAVNEETLEIPAGTLSKGEKQVDCAVRELKEETGYTSKDIKKLVSFYSTPGFSNEVVHLYIARKLSKGKKQLEWDEKIKVKYVSLTKALKMIKCGLIKDAKTIIAIAYSMAK